MNSIEDFKSFSIDLKIKVLYEKGIFIMSIRYYRYKINLYLLGENYVEVFVNHKQSLVEKIDLMDSNHSRMKFYIDQIKLPQLRCK